MRILQFLTFLIVVFQAALAWAQEPEPPLVPGLSSVYTKLSVDSGCVRIGADTLGGRFSCPGLGGYGIEFAESDLRTSVFYGHLGAWFLEGAWESFSAFNTVGDTVEWRLEDDIPFATIVRWTIDYGDGTGDDVSGQVLVISKVGQPGVGEACVIGYVDARANQNANEIARKVADDVTAGFACVIDDPQYHGEQSRFADIPVRTFGP